jgi:hypothetical protein
VRNAEVLQRVKEERNILQTVRIKKDNWNCHTLRKNFPLKHPIKGKIEERIEVTERRRRRSKGMGEGIKKGGGGIGN